MTDVTEPKPKRKILRLKLEPQEIPQQPRYADKAEAVYMVWCHDGGMPSRVYRSDEKDRAIGHAKQLCEETGFRFHVMRSFRIFDPAP